MMIEIYSNVGLRESGSDYIESGSGLISKQWKRKRKRKRVNFKVLEAEAEAEAASFKKLEAEAEAEALHAEAEAEAIKNSPLPHHCFARG